MKEMIGLSDPVDHIMVSSLGEFYISDDPSPDDWTLRLARLPQVYVANSIRPQPLWIGDESREKDSVCGHWKAETFLGQTHWSCESKGIIRLRLSLETTSITSVSSIGSMIDIRMTECRFLDSRFRMRQVRRPAIVDAWTPLAVSGQVANRYLQVREVERPMVSRIQPVSHDIVRITSFLDHQKAHPRFHFDDQLRRHWRSAYEWPAGICLEWEMQFVLTDRPLPIVVPGRLTDAYQAAMTITDHADHDSCEKFNALLYGDEDASIEQHQGFAGLGLGFTKSVFSATKDDQGPGLQNSKFLRVCKTAAEAGIEICPHGIHQTTQPKADDVATQLSCFETFETESWIDHGFSFLTTYAKEGWNPQSPFYLLPHLDHLGIKYLWGFLDFGQAVPGQNLDQLQIHRFSGWQFLKDQFRLVPRAFRLRRPWAIAHGLSVILFQTLPDEALRRFFQIQMATTAVMRQRSVRRIPGAVSEAIQLAFLLLQPKSLRELWQNFWGPREESLSFAPLLFQEHNSVRIGSNDKWLFNTVSVHDVAGAFADECIDQLIDDFGIHFAHTYLGSVSPAHISHPVVRSNGRWKLDPAFGKNLQYIADRRDAGKLLFAPVGQIVRRMAAQRSLRIRFDGQGWCVNFSEEWNSQYGAQILVVTEQEPEFRVRTDMSSSRTVIDSQRTMIVYADVNPGTITRISAERK